MQSKPYKNMCALCLPQPLWPPVRIRNAMYIFIWFCFFCYFFFFESRHSSTRVCDCFAGVYVVSLTK